MRLWFKITQVCCDANGLKSKQRTNCASSMKASLLSPRHPCHWGECQMGTVGRDLTLSYVPRKKRYNQKIGKKKSLAQLLSEFYISCIISVCCVSGGKKVWSKQRAVVSAKAADLATSWFLQDGGFLSRAESAYQSGGTTSQWLLSWI